MHIRNSRIALFIQRLYDGQNSCMSQAIKRISSGTRINSAADDAAGLAISEKTRARIRSLSAAQRNSEDAVSLVQTAEGVMASMHTVLQRMRELAVKSATDTNGDTDRSVLDAEYQQMLEELADIAREARYNGKLLISGGGSTAFAIQTGPDAGEIFNLVIDGVTPDALSLSGTHVCTGTAALNVLPDLDSAISRVSDARATLGAAQSRLGSRLNTIGGAMENLTAADSRIRDADIAEEMVRYTRAYLLAHVSAAMLAQANALAGNVLYLMSNQVTPVQTATETAAGGTDILADESKVETEKRAYNTEEYGGEQAGS